jgi:hypothetical protein
MPVFVVTITAPNGNKVSRPLVATCACDAIAEMHADHDVPADDPAFQTTVEQRPDPDGAYAYALLAGQRRRDEYDYWKGRR